MALSEGRITLRKAARRVRIQPNVAGIWGIESERGYDQAGPVLEERDGLAVREFRPVQNATAIGDRVRLDSFAHPIDPRQAHGLHFEEVLIPSPHGGMPAWRLDGRLDTWAIMVHGKGASRREALRIMPTIHEAGLPCLAITYRNDVDAFADPTSRYHYGRTEWEDLDAAANYAIEHGANRLILIGYSMGGAIAMSFMRRSRLAAHVRGLILDAPMLNFERTVAFAAANAHVPVRFLAISNRVASRRYGVRWRELDYLTENGHLQAPILLFHGDGDQIVPVSTSDALAAAVPHLVTYIRTPNAGHVRSWNTDPEAYESAVRTFLARTTA